MQADLLNSEYIAGCTPDGTSANAPDCGHKSCGILCDEAMLAKRAARRISSDFHAELAKPRGAGGHAAKLNAAARPVRELLALGFTLRDTARQLDVPVAEVVSLICTYPATAVLAAEAQLRQGVLTFQAIHEDTGITVNALRKLAQNLGTVSPATERRANGGGNKWSPEQYAEVVRLFDSGLRPIDVSRATGIPAFTCRWIRKNKQTA